MVNLRQAIGDTVRTLRHEQGMTLRDIASKQHIALGFLSEIETGKKEASSQVLEAIAQGLSLTTAQLLKEIYEYLEEVNA
jgi:transcriptional regulator with XRE-family HTH domain